MKKFPFLALLFLVTGIGLIIWFFVSGGGPYSKYTEHVTGKVYNCEQTIESIGESYYEYEGTVKYTVDGKDYSADYVIFGSDYYNDGESVELIYEPGNPSKVVTADQGKNQFLWVVIGGVAILLSIVLFFKWLRGNY